MLALVVLLISFCCIVLPTAHFDAHAQAPCSSSACDKLGDSAGQNIEGNTNKETVEGVQPPASLSQTSPQSPPVQADGSQAQTPNTLQKSEDTVLNFLTVFLAGTIMALLFRKLLIAVGLL